MDPLARTISIHALLAESDAPTFIVYSITDISIHALLAESDGFEGRQQLIGDISIHALLAESDIQWEGMKSLSEVISIHALLAESDQLNRTSPLTSRAFLSTLSLRRATWVLRKVPILSIFLSTLSLRRATVCMLNSPHSQKHFYPRSPCGERHAWEANNRAEQQISIHALLAESDPLTSRAKTILADFYPRSPCGERQPSKTRRLTNLIISIHALLAESDGTISRLNSNSVYFYPRSPCGERHDFDPSTTRRLTFLSTLSLRRATL